jgi:hypothetical protein
MHVETERVSDVLRAYEFAEIYLAVTVNVNGLQEAVKLLVVQAVITYLSEYAAKLLTIKASGSISVKPLEGRLQVSHGKPGVLAPPPAAASTVASP